MLGSHLPMSRKLLGDSAALLQSPIKCYNEKKSGRKECLGDQSLGVVSLLPWHCQSGTSVWSVSMCCRSTSLGKTQGWSLRSSVVHFWHTNTWHKLQKKLRCSSELFVLLFVWLFIVFSSFDLHGCDLYRLVCCWPGCYLVSLLPILLTVPDVNSWWKLQVGRKE